MSIKLHFTSKYDVLTYGKLKFSQSKYDERSDKHRFYLYGKQFKVASEAIQFLIANFLYQQSDWLYASDVVDAKKYYLRYHGIKSSLVYHINNDLNLIHSFVGKTLPDWSSIFNKTKSGNKPPILQLYLTKKVSPDTIIFLDRQQAFLSRLISENENDPLVSASLFKLVKYGSFSKVKSDNDLIENYQKMVG